MPLSIEKKMNNSQNAKQETIFKLAFKPFSGLKSPHLQTIAACFSPPGKSPPSTQKIIFLDDGDALCCEISTPAFWKENEKTIILIHGLGGCHQATYMIRLSRKFYTAGLRVVRVNMRSCGSGKEYAKRPYHGGLSNDIKQVVLDLKNETPFSPITIIGFSLGGNIALKLAGELGAANSDLVHSTIAICPPIDLAETAEIMARPINHLYNRYYMHHLDKLTKKWTLGHQFSNIFEFDKLVTAPIWGFSSPSEYYKKSSSGFLLDKIVHPCHILLCADDPFINYRTCLDFKRSQAVKIELSSYGGHMGFLGWADKEHGYYWLDHHLFKLINGLAAGLFLCK